MAVRSLKRRGLLFARLTSIQTGRTGDTRENPRGDGCGPRSATAAFEAVPHPSRESLRGLDWFIFFLADVQIGFGPFVAVYLTTQKWTQIEIGSVLSIGGMVALIGQIPGGAIIDAAKSERLVAGLAIARIGCGMADLSGGRGRGHAACRGELRARPGDRSDQSRSGGAAGDRRAVGAQCAFCLARKWRRRGLDGNVRLSVVEPLGLSGCLRSRYPDLACIGTHPRAGD